MGNRWRLVVAVSLAAATARAEAPAGAARPSTEAAQAGARSWLVALRDRLPDRLANATAFPLSVDGIAPKSGPDARRCRLAQSAKDAKALDAVARCLFAAKDFMDALPADFALARWKIVEATAIPETFDKKCAQLTALAKDHTLVQIELTGDTLNYTLLLALRSVGAAAAVSVVLADGKRPE